MSGHASARSRSRSTPSLRRRISVDSQHAATVQSPGGASRLAPRGSQARCASPPPAALSDQLQRVALQWTYRSFEQVMQARPTWAARHARPSLDRSRMEQMQHKTFSGTTHTLLRAYHKLLHEGVDAETHRRDDLAANVRDLVDGMKHKFKTTNPGNAAQAQRELELMLENIMDEFLWSQVADMFREAAERAEHNAQTAYERSNVNKAELTNLRHAAPQQHDRFMDAPAQSSLS